MALKDPTGLEKSVGELYLVMDGPPDYFYLAGLFCIISTCCNENNQRGKT